MSFGRKTPAPPKMEGFNEPILVSRLEGDAGAGYLC